VRLSPQREDYLSPLSLAANPDFPLAVPPVLRLSEGAIRAIAAVIGITAGIACSLVIYFLANPGGMTGRLFNLREPFAAIPVLILIVFFWGLAICIVRYLRISAAGRVCGNSLLLDSMQVGNLDGLDNLSRDLASARVQCSPLLRRLQAVTTHWLITPNLQDADVLLQQHLYFDEEDVRSGYSLVRTFIWALPVIGLLGTVAGVAVAIGGFAEFLGGEIEDVAVIKRSLVNVTAGLSYAFLTTLYGLASALILMLLATSLQTREEKLYSSVQQRVTNLFLPFLQKISPEQKGGDVGSMSGLQEQLMKISTTVLDYVRQQGSLTLQSFNDERNILRENVVQWGQLIREQSSAGAHDIGQALDRIGMKMSNAHFDFLQRFEAAKAEMDQQAASVLQSTCALGESVSLRQQHMLEGLSQQNAIVQRNADLLAELSKLSREATDQNSRMNNTLATLVGLNLEERARDIVQIMESHKKEIEASVSALAHNSSMTGEVLAAQSSLHDSVTKLHETGLVETLREFRNSLTDLKPILENLREPFILQAIPVSKDRMSS
jgi:biopolymer transport protein ExbB/TolQ